MQIKKIKKNKINIWIYIIKFITLSANEISDDEIQSYTGW
jgi:hypothetical protein